ncbi:acyltransferase family protein [Cytobacillus kochii]|uniref:Acyltransferase 3 domain-containing protein n=1 Tax=Cytobacillus kochii TaxID=859143 RepID=A0A248TJ48_9BACI|nr:acyltransferase family protein [Cytobacillus kochii]ASV68238.1 hypothetical protein CKF48_13435 [Cytobacillus kochii]
MVKEWNLLRTIACLSVVFLHSSTQIGRSFGYPSIENMYFLRVILTYATPTFIVLSEIILANKYKDKIPPKFFTKRIKLIILPFIAFAIIDALVVNSMSESGIDIFAKIQSNLMGNFIGYFILIIFQFYILHYLIVKFRISVLKLLPWSILIMVGHLYILNSEIPFVVENRALLKLPFTAWFGYFTVAFLIGAYYEKIIAFLKTYKWIPTIALGYVILLILIGFEGGYNQVDSRRLDIFPLSIAISLTILAWGQLLPNLNIVNKISNYSLGIYLVHWQVQRIFTPYLIESIPNISPYILVGILFLFSIAFSMVFIKLVSFIPFGKYIIGNTKRKFDKSKTTPQLN